MFIYIHVYNFYIANMAHNTTNIIDVGDFERTIFTIATIVAMALGWGGAPPHKLLQHESKHEYINSGAS